MTIHNIRDADELFPFPMLSTRSMTDEEMATLQARLQATIQRALGASTSARHAPLPPIVL